MRSLSEQAGCLGQHTGVRVQKPQVLRRPFVAVCNGNARAAAYWLMVPQHITVAACVYPIVHMCVGVRSANGWMNASALCVSTQRPWEAGCCMLGHCLECCLQRLNWLVSVKCCACSVMVHARLHSGA